MTLDRVFGSYPEGFVLNLTPETERVYNNAPAFEVDINDPAKYNAGVLLISEDIADRRREVTLGENSRRSLTSQDWQVHVYGEVKAGLKTVCNE